MGLGTSPTIFLADRIRKENTLRMWVTNLGPEVNVHMVLHYDLGPPPGPTAKKATLAPPITKKATLAAGGSMRLELDASQVPLLFDKSGRAVVRGEVVADSQPAVLMVTVQRVNHVRKTAMVVGWAQLVALGPAAGKAVPLAAAV